jgi:hypothetical protein
VRNFIFLSVLFSVGIFMNAQEVSYGLKAGINLATLRTSMSEFNELSSSRTSFHAGGVVEVAFSDQFSVQPEILYSSVGAKMTFDNTPSPSPEVRVESTTSNELFYVIDYLTIPVMAKYYAVEGLSLEAGPQVGFLLAAQAKNDSNSEDMKEEFESTDFGIAIGAAYKMENGLFFNARYVIGLTNIVKEVSGDDYVKNDVFQISLGFLFK